MNNFIRILCQVIILGTCTVSSIAQPKPSPCCARVYVVPSTTDQCCSRLRIDSGCVVRTIKITVAGGVFTSLNWNCGAQPNGAVGQSTYTLVPAGACKSFAITACTKATGAGLPTVDYAVTFSDGSICLKQDTKKCCCTPPIMTPKSACRGLPATFKVDTSTCKIANGMWNFGDGSPATSILNPTHVYTSQGNYTVTFTYDNGCGRQKWTSLVVVTACPCKTTPCISYKITKLTVQFNGAGTTSNDPIVYYHWDFGDGTWANGVNPTHTYALPGSYKVCLTVYVDDGNVTGEYCGTTLCEIIGVASTAPQTGSTCPTIKSEIQLNPEASNSIQYTNTIKNAPQTGAMTAYPNPFNNAITVVVDIKNPLIANEGEGALSFIEVYNLQGQLISRQPVEAGLQETALSMPQAPTGVYLISLRQNGRVVSTIKALKN